MRTLTDEALFIKIVTLASASPTIYKAVEYSKNKEKSISHSNMLLTSLSRRQICNSVNVILKLQVSCRYFQVSNEKYKGTEIEKQSLPVCETRPLIASPRPRAKTTRGRTGLTVNFH